MRPPLLVSATLIAASNVAGPSTSIHHIAKRAIPSFSLVKPHPHSSSTLRSVRFVSTARPTATENTNNPDPSSPSPTRQIRPQRKPTRSPSRFVSPNSPRRPKPAETETPIKPVPEQKSLWQSYLNIGPANKVMVGIGFFIFSGLIWLSDGLVPEQEEEEKLETVIDRRRGIRPTEHRPT